MGDIELGQAAGGTSLEHLKRLSAPVMPRHEALHCLDRHVRPFLVLGDHVILDIVSCLWHWRRRLLTAGFCVTSLLSAVDMPTRHDLRAVDSLYIQERGLVAGSLQRSLTRSDESPSVAEKTFLVASRQVIELLC